MLRLLLCLCAFLPGLADDPKLGKAMDAWLKAWRAGRVDLTSQADVERTSVLKQQGVLPKGLVGRLTALRELEILLDLAVQVDDAETTTRLLAFAAAGLEPGEYSPKQAPRIVRTQAEQALARLKSAASRQTILGSARGEGERDRPSQAAALRMLGRLGDESAREVLEKHLGATEPYVRAAAADSLTSLAHPDSCEALIRTLQHEKDEQAIDALVGALTRVFDKHSQQISADVAKAAIEVSIAQLGRGTWRTDMTLVAFLERFRSADAIPTLIAVLERFQSNPEEVRAGKLSGLLKHRAHEALVSLTGAGFPSDQPQLWREFWEKEKATFQVPPPKEKKSYTTSAGGFFGLPVQGTRVVFVVDVSGSMGFPIGGGGTAAPGGKLADSLRTRMDVAKEELLFAIEQLPEVASFSCVLFSDEASLWNDLASGVVKLPELLPATRKNKDAFKAFVERKEPKEGSNEPRVGMFPQAGTNVWAGLEAALKLKAPAFLSRYGVNIDELFMLSDGLPSVGEVRQPKDILAKVAEANRTAKIRINAVYIQGEPHPRDLEAIRTAGMSGADFMKALAEQNGGKFAERR
jgi:hypothetical protein